jgi:hypothetical protein
MKYMIPEGIGGTSCGINWNIGGKTSGAGCLATIRSVNIPACSTLENNCGGNLLNPSDSFSKT